MCQWFLVQQVPWVEGRFFSCKVQTRNSNTTHRFTKLNNVRIRTNAIASTAAASIKAMKKDALTKMF
jgi:hypothetical protein